MPQSADVAKAEPDIHWRRLQVQQRVRRSAYVLPDAPTTPSSETRRLTTSVGCKYSVASVSYTRVASRIHASTEVTTRCSSFLSLPAIAAFSHGCLLTTQATAALFATSRPQEPHPHPLPLSFVSFRNSVSTKSHSTSRTARVHRETQFRYSCPHSAVGHMAPDAACVMRWDESFQVDSSHHQIPQPYFGPHVRRSCKSGASNQLLLFVHPP